MKKINEYLIVMIFILTAVLVAVAGLKAYQVYDTDRRLAREQEELELAQVFARNEEAQGRVQEMRSEIQELTKDRDKLEQFLTQVQQSELTDIVIETDNPDTTVSGNDMVLVAGTVSGNTIVLPEGTVSGNGVILTGGTVPGNGVVLTGGTVSGNGVILAGGTVSGNGVILPDGAGTGYGAALPEGTVSGNVVILTGGTVSGNGGILPDGAGTGYGVILPGVTVSGNTLILSDDTVSGNRVILPDGRPSDRAEILSGGTVSGNRMILPGGTVSGNVVLLSGVTVSGNTIRLPYGTVSGNMILWPGGTVSANGLLSGAFPGGASGNGGEVNYYDGSMTNSSIFDAWREIYEQPEGMTLAQRRELRTSLEETLEVNQSDRERIAEKRQDFSGLKIACLGDSITAGSNLDGEENYQQYSYPAKLKELLGAEEVYNLGIGGSSIGRYWADAYVDRYQEIPADTDIIIVMGGTNDGFCVSDKEFGSLEERAYRTFCGDLDELMGGLSEKYPNAEIFFATPLPNVLQDYLMKERDYLLPQQRFVDVMLTLADEHDYEVIDLYNSNILDSHDANVVADYMPDGVHGNHEGYQVMAEHFAARIIEHYDETGSGGQSGEEDKKPAGTGNPDE